MENSLSSIIEGLQLDLQELEKFISTSTRPNIKRQLEEQRKIIKLRIDEENKKIEISRANLEKAQENSNIPVQKPKSQNYESITKYSFLSEDKFVK